MENQVKDILESTIEYINRLEIELPKRVDKFRQNTIESNDYIELEQLIEGIQWIINVVKLTEKYHSIKMIEINGILIEFLDGLEMKDTTLIADILEYELIDIFFNIRDEFIPLVYN